VAQERTIVFPEGFRIMESEGKSIGYICSEIWKKAIIISKDLFDLGNSIRKHHYANGTELYISSMGILPEYRGKGLGEKLFEDFLAYITGTYPCLESIILIVSEKWLNARKVYIKNGFHEIAIFEGFFSYTDREHHSENGIVMRKELLQKF
jgi:ribosomal-protein-alanine N-acetyltransferase